MNRPKIAIDDCPSAALLQKFALGALHPGDVERVVLHLSSSPDCACHEVLATLECERDELTVALGGSFRATPLPTEAESFSTCRGEDSVPESGLADQGDRVATSRPAAFPARIGRYRIVEPIGRGGMGEVYRGRDEELGRDVAIKIVRRDGLSTDSAVLRFQAEAQAAAGLDHPHIVPIYEVGVDGDYHFLAMKLVEGCSLAECGREYVAQPRRAAEDMAAVARAIHYAHQRQLLHRDLKPGNILLDSSGVPYVADFGLAKRLDAQSDLTCSGAIVGTPGYMAPEQAAGAPHDVTTASDVYGLGGVLYFLLTGRPPHEAATPIETCRQVVDSEPIPPRRLNPSVDRDLETICLNCLEKSPTRRYTAAAEVANDLDRYLNGEPILARAVGPFERLLRWCRRRPIVAALTACVLLLAIVIGIGSPLAAMALHQQKNVATRRADEATRNLFAARTALARAERLGDQPNRRSAALAAVRDAVEASKSVAVDLADVRAVRNEAVGSLALADIRRAQTWSFDGKVINCNSEQGYFAHTAGKSDAVVLRRVNDFAEVARLPDLGSRPMLVQFLPAAAGVVVLYESRSVSDDQEIPPPVSSSPENGSREARTAAEDGDVASGTRRIACWKPGSPTPTWTRSGDFSPLGVRVYQDGKYLVAANNAGTLHILATESGEPQGEIATGLKMPFLTMHPGRSWVAVGNGGQKVACYDLVTGDSTAEFQFEDPVSGFTWQPGGKLVAVTGWDSALQLWDVERNRLVRSLLGHERLIVHVSFNAAGDLVATQSYDGTTRLWSTASGRELARLPGGPGVFSHTGSRLAVAASQFGRSTMELWDCSESGEFSLVALANDGELTPRAIAVTPDGSRAIAAGDDGIRVFDIITRSQQQHVPLPNSHSVVCHPDGTHVIVNSHQGLFRFRLSDSATAPLAEREELSGPSTGGLRGLAQSGDGERLAATVGDGKVRLFDFAAGSPRDLDVRPDWSGLAVRGDGRLVAAFLPRHIGVWDFATREPVTRIAHVGDGYARLTFSPDGNHLVVGDSLSFRSYDGRTWSTEFTHSSGPGALWGVSAFSPDGRLLAIATTRNTARLIDPRTGDELCTLVSPRPWPDITALCFTPDGARLLVAGSNRLIQVWNIATLRRSLSELGLNWVDGQ